MTATLLLAGLAGLAACGGGGQQVRGVSGQCDAAHPDVCRDLGARAESGLDGRANPARAAELYRLAAEGYLARCEPASEGAGVDADGLACAQLAELYRHGRGVVQSPAEATRLDERACVLGVSRTCK
ncbi:MAG: hypothetical protein IT370_00125 [Deltaproteobacteria bacterium]|nr:hypothetical protein [Deltaproteobacteria bacterium]